MRKCSSRWDHLAVAVLLLAFHCASQLQIAQMVAFINQEASEKVEEIRAKVGTEPDAVRVACSLTNYLSGRRRVQH